jgi:hypothetical protein
MYSNEVVEHERVVGRNQRECIHVLMAKWEKMVAILEAQYEH